MGLPSNSNSDDEISLRIIVLTYDRPGSLKTCLNHIARMETEGDKIVVDIYIDKHKNKVPRKGFSSKGHHIRTVKVAKSFRFDNSLATVHLQQQHVGVYGQWIDSWKPPSGTKEVALFVEDDLDVSPYFWKWLKAAYLRYRHEPDVMGISLRGNTIASGEKAGEWLVTKKIHNAFMYKLMGSHGFAPLPDVWNDFRLWFHNNSKNAKFKPYVPNLEQTKWYKRLDKKGKRVTMWTMWSIYYSWIQKLFIVYPNLSGYNKRPNITRGELIVHRAGKGLHSKKANTGADQALLTQWDDALVQFPRCIARYDWNGEELDYY